MMESQKDTLSINKLLEEIRNRLHINPRIKILKSISKNLEAILKKFPDLPSDDRFQHVWTSRPMKFPEISLDEFRLKYESEFYYGIHACLSDKNYPSRPISTSLKKIVLYRLDKAVHTHDYMQFIKSCGGILLGARGMAWAWLRVKDSFIKDGYKVACPDSYENLYQEDGEAKIPCIGIDKCGDFGFNVYNYDDFLPGERYILFFLDVR